MSAELKRILYAEDEVDIQKIVIIHHAKGCCEERWSEEEGDKEAPGDIPFLHLQGVEAGAP